MAAGLGLKTFVTGDVLTAADTNGYLMQGVWVFASAAARDAAVTSPQEGNMCYLKDTDAVQYYSGSAWTAVGGSSGFTGVMAFPSAALSIPNSTETAVGLNSETYDTSTFHDTSTNNSRLTVPAGKAGYYRIWGNLAFVTNATGLRSIRIKKNTSTDLVDCQITSNSGYGTRLSTSTTVSLAVADYVEMYAWQNSGGALNVDNGVSNTQFGFQYLGA